MYDILNKGDGTFGLIHRDPMSAEWRLICSSQSAADMANLRDKLNNAI